MIRAIPAPATSTHQNYQLLHIYCIYRYKFSASYWMHMTSGIHPGPDIRRQQKTLGNCCMQSSYVRSAESYSAYNMNCVHTTARLSFLAALWRKLWHPFSLPSFSITPQNLSSSHFTFLLCSIFLQTAP